MSENEKVGIPLFPHINTPEAQQKFMAAIKKRNGVDYACYQALQELFDNGVIADHLSKEDYEDIRDLLTARHSANDEVLAIVAGK